MSKILVNKYRCLEKGEWGEWKYELFDFTSSFFEYQLGSLEQCAVSLSSSIPSKRFSLLSSSRNKNGELERGVHALGNGNYMQCVEPSDEELAKIMKFYFSMKS